MAAEPTGSRRTVGTERGFDRLVFFSDAVVAIAITLLILPVVDIVTADQSLSDLFDDERSRLIVFGVSFAVIARFWTAHHRVFEHLERYTDVLVWVNMAWLASIVFLPFPTELLGVRGTSEALVRFLYIASVLANSTLLLALEIVVMRSPTLWNDDTRPDVSLVPGVVTVIALVVALIVGTAVKAIGIWAMLVLVITGPLGARIERRRSITRRRPV